jgi:hypothetical protein
MDSLFDTVERLPVPYCMKLKKLKNDVAINNIST